MPQMAPLMWASLFFSFSVLLLFMVTKITFSPKINTLMNEVIISSSPNTNMLNWKW